MSLTEARSEPLSSPQPRPVAFLSYLRQVAIIVLWAIFLLALLNRGATEIESRIVVTAAIYLLLVPAILLFGPPRAGAGKVLVAACFLLAALIVQMLLQASSMPAIAAPNPAWSVATMFTQIAPVATISLTPADDRLGLMSAALPFGAFMAGLVIFDTDELAAKTLRWFAIAGGWLALFSILQFVLFPEALGVVQKRAYLGSLTGLFVNRNTAATFFGLILLTLLVLLHKRLLAPDWGRVKALVANRLTVPDDQKRLVLQAAFIGALTAFCFIALMLTGSRAGIMSSFAALVVLILLTIFNSPARIGRNTASPRRRRRGSRRWAALMIAVAIALFSLFANRVALRMETRMEDDMRFCYMPGITRAIADNWPLGSGLASFAEIYAPYHLARCGVDAVVTHAHNVYAEGLLTVGAAFPFYAAFFIVAQLLIFIRGARKRKNYRYASHLGLAGLLLVLLHSTLDFSLQIPGFAMTYAVFLAPVVTLCLNPPGVERGGRRRRMQFPGSEGPAKDAAHLPGGLGSA
ncbi:O-antigen ligase family protein [Agrobacterium sp. SOY23]|uniref:O-antigen ligase family protein n=1 Tax=Agrobacterium sp. SOY23 TaxID=3014555 RepID=UPI0022AEE928|nr:O-antigen ligase family protein [Agrobacterium sp. SOY23]MCZ4429854.1 O-antigen ligase family protein [Agrobacterium sp. SOY23]